MRADTLCWGARACGLCPPSPQGVTEAWKQATRKSRGSAVALSPSATVPSCACLPSTLAGGAALSASFPIFPHVLAAVQSGVGTAPSNEAAWVGVKWFISVTRRGAAGVPRAAVSALLLPARAWVPCRMCQWYWGSCFLPTVYGSSPGSALGPG